MPSTIFLIFALVLAILAGCGCPSGRFSLIGFALAFYFAFVLASEGILGR